MTFRSWQYISCHWDACSYYHLAISDFLTEMYNHIILEIRCDCKRMGFSDRLMHWQLIFLNQVLYGWLHYQTIKSDGKCNQWHFTAVYTLFLSSISISSSTPSLFMILPVTINSSTKIPTLFTVSRILYRFNNSVFLALVVEYVKISQSQRHLSNSIHPHPDLIQYFTCHNKVTSERPMLFYGRHFHWFKNTVGICV